MTVIGIDLGTTNSLVGYYNGERVKLIRNRFGSLMTPSVVAESDGDIVVGETAKHIQATTPHLAASAFKRFIGTDKTYRLAGMTLDAVDLSSLVIRSLKQDAELHLGTTIEQVVISVPAYFNDAQRNATIKAAKLEGLTVLRLINEPTAAALAYQMLRPEAETVLAIVDLGGGTFDVSILDIFESIVEVRAVAGDNYLGGEDFDHAIIKWLKTATGLNNADLKAQDYAILKYEAEQAKITLSNQNRVTLNFKANGQQHTVELHAQQLEQILAAIIEKMRLPLIKAVRDSSFKIDDIDNVILVGGSTRSPIVKRFISKMFQKLPLQHINPDEVVAIGATVAAEMASKKQLFQDTVLTDVCPYTLGIATHSELPNGRWVNRFDPIIERNSTVPTSVVKPYCTVRDNQKKITVDVYQGESHELQDNLKLGELTVRVPAKPAGEATISTRFTYDINGILEVEVTVDDTGEVKRDIMINVNHMSKLEIKQQMAKLAKLKIHPRDSEENRLLLARAKHLYEVTLGETRLRIGEAIDLFNSVLEEQNHDVIKEHIRKFKRFLDSIEDSY